jgi:hypothetical protein
LNENIETTESAPVTETKVEKTLAELLQPARGANESYEDYTVRRKSSSTVLKRYKRGTLVFDASKRKPFVNPNHDLERADRLTRRAAKKEAKKLAK